MALRFSDRALVDYHMERDVIPLHDVVEVNLRDAITENQGAGAWCMG